MARLVRLDKVKGYPVSFCNNTEANIDNGLFLELTGLYENEGVVEYGMPLFRIRGDK